MPPASADGEVSVSVSNGVIYDSCDYYPYSYTPPFGYDNWSIDFQLIGPDGNEVDTDYAYDGDTAATQFFICESPNLAGTYEIEVWARPATPTTTASPSNPPRRRSHCACRKRGPI